MPDEFPKMLYSSDGHFVVKDAAEQAEALKAGWRTADQRRALDLDDNGEPGGSKPKRRKATSQ